MAAPLTEGLPEYGKAFTRPRLEVLQGLGEDSPRTPGPHLRIASYLKHQSGELVPEKTVRVTDMVEFYETNGFVQFAPIDRDQALALGDEIADLIRKRNHNAQWNQEGIVLDLHQVHVQSDSVHELIHDPDLLINVGALLKDDPTLHHVKAFIKPAGHGGIFPPHRDNDFYPHRTDQLVAVTFNLSDITEAEGPVAAFPGSHLRTDLTPLPDYPTNPQFSPTEWPRENAVKLSGPAGTRSAHHGRVVHLSAPNTSENDRRTVIIQFRGKNNLPLRPVNRKLYPDEGTVLAQLAS